MCGEPEGPELDEDVSDNPSPRPPFLFYVRTDSWHPAGMLFTATVMVQAGTQQTNALLEIAENPINWPDYRTHQDGL
jgi:hypothetical protein